MEKNDLVAVKVVGPRVVMSTMDSVLSLDHGRWWCLAEEFNSPILNESWEDPLQLLSIKQPSCPPVLAQVHQEYAPVPPKVADPRLRRVKSSKKSTFGPATYQLLHVVILFIFS